jgi:ribosomal protein S18 acetylase RimI-like enzyme
VWHIGLFVVATKLHGTGSAALLYEGLEDWMRRRGVRWLRLNVASGNRPAERFWEKSGYTEVRRRDGVDIGSRIHTMRVMMKPLANGSMAEYLDLVTRDRPGAP